MSILFPPELPADAPRGWHRLMDQEKYWVGGQVIREMSLGHIENTLAMLLRDSGRIVNNYFGSMNYMLLSSLAPDDVIFSSEREEWEARGDTQAWVKSTKAFKALKRERKRRRKLIKWSQA